MKWSGNWIYNKQFERIYKDQASVIKHRTVLLCRVEIPKTQTSTIFFYHSELEINKKNLLSFRWLWAHNNNLICIYKNVFYVVHMTIKQFAKSIFIEDNTKTEFTLEPEQAAGTKRLSSMSKF